MFDFDKITESAQEIKELIQKNLPEAKQKFEELQQTGLEIADSLMAEIQFNGFMTIAPFFFTTIDTGEKDAAGAPVVKAKYMADKHANAFMACRKNFMATQIILAQEEDAEAETEEEETHE